MSPRGYWRALNERMACNPAIRITRLTTIANTGRLTNRSVNFTVLSSNAGNPVGVRPLSTFRSAVFGLGAWTILRLNRVVDLDRSAVAEPEDTRAHNFVSWVNAGCDSNLIASRALHLHHLLAHSKI